MPLFLYVIKLELKSLPDFYCKVLTNYLNLNVYI